MFLQPPFISASNNFAVSKYLKSDILKLAYPVYRMSYGQFGCFVFLNPLNSHFEQFF